MSRKISRRTMMAGTAAGVAAAAFNFPKPAIAQSAPFKLGLLTVKTGPLAQGGIQMEQGVLTWLKQHNNTMGGRKVEFISADTGGKPAGTKTKAQELIERDKVDVILGPLAAFELLAISDYIREHKTPTLSLAGADDLTQRKPNPYFLRPSATSSQAMQPMGHYAATEMGKKRAITIDYDFAFGYEQQGGFQSAFQKDGGCVTKKLWAPLGTPDYTPYLAQMSDFDVLCQGFAGSGPLAFMKQYANVGLKQTVVTGETGGDDALLHAFGDEALGMMSCCPYTLDLDTDANKKFAQAVYKQFNVVPGFYCAGLYVNCDVVNAALHATGGKTDDKDKFMAALKAVDLKDTPRGPIKFDHLGNVVGNFYVRRIEKMKNPYGLKLWNKTVKTYDNVSQFWTWPEKDFLAHPVYSRDYPPIKC
ncbi:MAG TPA: ABC transporter substrate-binding protein [Pseudolabrys sp.]|nr:ABC transporter substrate-binding protein [Pseudolabrys sp.]